ncbi:MAG: glycine cleavage system protein GcvH [Firmicutes bacterium]|nr:glycine cleavage system protein GcvH [Bacillota bacterium]
MNHPEHLFYTKSHEWILFTDDTTAKIGITDFAQDELGDLVFINLPEEGDEVEIDQVFADLESVKAVSDIYGPVNGKISAVNEILMDEPELINSDPYGAWFIEVSDITEKMNFLSAAEYIQFCEEEKELGH